MPLSTSLETSFTAGGFSLSSAFDGLSTLLTEVDLPGLDLRVDVSLEVTGLDTEGVTGALGGVTGGLDAITGALPDAEQLIAPLQLALRLPELLSDLDLQALSAALAAAVTPAGPGLVALVDATGALGSVPLVGSLSELLRALGLDLAGPAGLLGRTAGGLVTLAGILGALLAVEAASGSLENRAVLAVDLLQADRITGLVGQLRATGGAHLATLLTGIDPDDRSLVELVAAPVETYLGLVVELNDALVRGLAFAQATVVDADFPALVGRLTTASLVLAAANPAPVRALVDSAAPLIAPVLALRAPGGGEEVVFGGVAALRAQLEAAIDGLAPDTLAALVTPAVAPILSSVRAVQQALDELAGVLGVVFAPIEQALDAVDLSSIRAAIDAVVTPVADAVAALDTGIGDAQGAIEAAVGAVHDALTPVRTGLTNAAGALTTPFTEVHGAIAALDLAGLQESVRTTLGSVTAAIAAAPIQPVFDVATGIIGTTADALGLVPKALLPDDLRRELEAACAPVEALDLEPARSELHDQLAAMIAGIDASALDAVSAGFAAVQRFVDSIDPHPLVAQLETDAFAALVGALDALDPTQILAPVLAALETAKQAIAIIDLTTTLRPVDEALDTVAATIADVDPGELLAPVSQTLDGATATVRDALHLDDLSQLLSDADAVVAAAIARIPLEETLTGLEGAWADLLDGLRGTDARGRPEPPAGVGRALLAGLLPGVPVAGLPEVIAWIRGERDGAAVVRQRLDHAAAELSAASLSVGSIDVGALTAELTATHRALTAALDTHPADSLLVRTLSTPVRSTDPAPDLGRVVVNADGVRAALAAAAGVVDPMTAPDRTEVQRSADGLAAAFAPLHPLLDKARELATFIGIDPATLSGPGGLRTALATLAERLGPDVFIGTLRAVATRLFARLSALVHDGLIGPLQQVVGELTGLLDGLSVEALLADFTAVRTRLVALVDGLRPSTVLAEPLAAFAALQHTLDTFDPMRPVRTVVDGLRAEITTFAHDLAPRTLLAPVLTVYDDIAAAVGAFDVAGLLEPVLAALHAVGEIIDRGMDGVIDALARLKVACESEGGPIPGVDLSVAASVDVGGLL